MLCDEYLRSTLNRISGIDFGTSRISDIAAAIARARRAGTVLTEEVALQRLQLKEDAIHAGVHLLATFISDGLSYGKELVLMRNPSRYHSLLDLGENGGPFDPANYVLYQHPGGSVDMRPAVFRYLGSRRPLTIHLELGDVVRFFHVVDEHIIPIPIKPVFATSPYGTR